MTEGVEVDRLGRDGRPQREDDECLLLEEVEEGEESEASDADETASNSR